MLQKEKSRVSRISFVTALFLCVIALLLSYLSISKNSSSFLLFLNFFLFFKLMIIEANGLFEEKKKKRKTYLDLEGEFLSGLFHSEIKF